MFGPQLLLDLGFQRRGFWLRRVEDPAGGLEPGAEGWVRTTAARVFGPALYR